MMCLVAQQDGSGLVQVIFVAFIGVMWLLSHLVKKARREQQTMQTHPGERPAARPPASEALTQVRQFFESMQQQVEPRPPSRTATAARARRARRPAKAVPVKASEEPESTELLSERMKRKDVERRAEASVAAVVSKTTLGRGLERVLANPRLSPAARAIVLSEIVGTPRALHPHRSPFEME